MKTSRITTSVASFLLVQILAACSFSIPRLQSPTPSSPLPTSTTIVTISPILTQSYTPTPSITPTPTVTSTKTITLSSTPSYPGGALILFTGVQDQTHKLNCGLATADGKILREEPLSPFDGVTLFTAGGAINPPRFCAPGSGINNWSPDMQQFVFYIYSNQDYSYRLYLGNIDSIDYSLLMSFSKPANKPFSKNPNFQWLGNEYIWYYDTDLHVTILIDVKTKKNTTLKIRVTSSSPDGKYITYLDGESLYLKQFENNHLVNLDQVAKNQAIHLDQFYKTALGHPDDPLVLYFKNFIKWSPDSKKLAIFSEKDNTNTWSIFDQDGNYLTHVGGESTSSEVDFTWSPLSNRELVDCVIKKVGQYSEKNMCLFDLQGGLLDKFSWHQYRNSAGNISSDGRYIFYLLSDYPPALGSNYFSAKLMRIDIETGEELVIGKGLQDLSWIYSYLYIEQYKKNSEEISSVSESPDGNYFIMNDAGSFFDYTPTEKMVFSVFCTSSDTCKDFKLQDLSVIGAEWLNPASGWKP